MKYCVIYKRMVLVITIIFLLFATTTKAEPKNKKCLKYEPTEIQLSGILFESDFLGNINYETIGKTGEPIIYWVLSTEKPVCVIADKLDKINETEHDISTIQLVFLSAESRKIAEWKKLLEKMVTVKGSLFHSISAHHATKVLLTVKDITLLKGNQHLAFPIRYPEQFNEYWYDISQSLGDNNRDHILCGKYSESHGATGCNDGFAIFPKSPDSTDALFAMPKTKRFKNMSNLDSVFSYEPPSVYSLERYKKCTQYRPMVVTLSGNLIQRHFPPKGYELEEQEKPYNYGVLEISKPFCVIGSPFELTDTTEFGVGEVSFSLWEIKKVAPKIYEQVINSKQVKVKITGRLLPATTGHNRTKVLMDIQKIKRSP